MSKFNLSKKTDNQSKKETVRNESLARNCISTSGKLLRPMEHDGKKGFVDEEGNWIIAPQYDDMDVFREGVAWVKADDSWGLVDHEGRVLIER